MVRNLILRESFDFLTTVVILKSVVSGQGAVPTPSLVATVTGGTIPLSPAPVPLVTQELVPQPTQQPAPQPTQQPAPEPAPAPSPPAVEGGIPGYPFPISQTTLNPGQTQAPGPQPGQAVHELTTTEMNVNHNITTTEYWFGKANETLNRTNGNVKIINNKLQH